MAIRRLAPTRRRITFSLEAFFAGASGRGEWELYWGGPEQGREAAETFASQLRRHGDVPLEVWWFYTAGIPAELRGDDADEEARLLWLLNGGEEHLGPGDPAVIRGRLDALREYRDHVARRNAFLVDQYRAGELSPSHFEYPRARVLAGDTGEREIG